MARKGKKASTRSVDLKRTRASSTYVTIGVAIVFLILLVVFIAQNNKSVPVHFFTASGHVSEALALVIAAVGGGLVVLVAGSTRILQLRVRARRTNKAMSRKPSTESTSGSSGGDSPTKEELDSAVAASKSES